RNNSGHVPCQRCVLWAGWVSSCYGGHSVEETPGSIPNPEAKLDCADGTALGRVWESRSPPDIFTGEWRSSRTPAGCSPPPLPFSRPETEQHGQGAIAPAHHAAGRFAHLRVPGPSCRIVLPVDSAVGSARP